MYPVFNTQFGFALTMACFLGIFYLGWWLHGVLTKYSITSILLRETAEDLTNKANFFDDVALAEAPDTKHIAKWRTDANILIQAAKLIESSHDTNDPGAGF